MTLAADWGFLVLPALMAGGVLAASGAALLLLKVLADLLGRD